MDYEKKYKEVLKRASKLRVQNPFDTVGQMVEHIFPELKESEDERIRKGLIKAVSGTLKGNTLYGTDVTREEALAWLEKQGEQKETPCDKCKKEQPSHSCQDITELGRCALEKQNEQKPGVKIKPKFHEDEWVILTAGELSTTLQIGKVDTDKKLYWFNDDIYLPVVDEECLHRWTIQDAKAGDVLVYETDEVEWIFIYREIVPAASEVPHDLLRYYFLLEGNNFNWNGVSAMITDDYKLYLKPATKEQRDVLFSKMKEAGYEWDSEKKELKKIEVKTLNADKVIAWLVANICDFEHYVKLFKKDFGLC